MHTSWSHNNQAIKRALKCSPLNIEIDGCIINYLCTDQVTSCWRNKFILLNIASIRASEAGRMKVETTTKLATLNTKIKVHKRRLKGV